MAKPRSRVEQEALEAKKRSTEIQQEIDSLSKQIANPQKYFTPKPDERSRSTVERFYRYFNAASQGGEKRKATRAEMRAQRVATAFWLVIALIITIWVVGKLIQQLHK